MLILEIICLIVGAVLLIEGSQVLIMGTSDLGKRFKLSTFVINITIIAFATSIPELFVSIKAMSVNLPEVLVFNIIGSNIVNTLLIIGLVSLMNPLKINNNTITKELPLNLISVGLFVFLVLDDLFLKKLNNTIGIIDAFVLIIFFLIYIYYMVRLIRVRKDIRILEKPMYTPIRSILYSGLGISMIIVGSIFSVNMIYKISLEFLNIKILSVFLLALITSLPELIYGIRAIKNQDDLIIGNVIGSNIFNICICIAIPVIILGNLNVNFLSIVDLLNLLISAIIIFLFAQRKSKIGKFEGIIMLSVFLIYFVYIIVEGVLL